MKAKFLMLASFIFVFFVSCDSSSIDESEPVAAATSSELAKAAVERPISISIVGTDTPTGSTFVGTMSHLGTIYGDVVTTLFEPNPDGSFNFESDDVIYAANGDELYSHSVLLFAFTSQLTATYTATITFTGGTGRFVGATGYMTVLNGAYIINGDTAIGTSSHTANGMIKY